MPATPATIIDLGTLGGSYSVAMAINASGQVAGYSATASGATHAFLWTPGIGMTDLGTLQGGASMLYHDGINSAGEVVGLVQTIYEYAFVYTATNGITELVIPNTGASVASGVNSAGQIAGYSTFVGGDTAWLYTPGGGLLYLTGMFAAFAINDAAQVVGYSNAGRAILYTPGSGLTDLGTLGGADSYAFGINSAGQVVGYSANTAGFENAFLYTPGSGMTNLGTLGGTSSYAFGINNAGQVAGYSLTATPGGQSAFLYSNGTMIDLNSVLPPNSGWQLSVAEAINDSGQIVGSGTINGQAHAFLLDTTPPAKTNPTITWPAPAAITFGGALGAGQLDATSNVAGNFVYNPPAGTVLPVGNGQTLSAVFTPNDTTDYNSVAASTTINVKPGTPSGTPASLVVTNVLTRQAAGPLCLPAQYCPAYDIVYIAVQLTVSNTGGTAATNVVLSAVKVGGYPTAPLPQGYVTTLPLATVPVYVGTIAPGTSAQVVLAQPNALVGPSGTASSLSVSGTYAGGAFSSNTRVTLP